AVDPKHRKTLDDLELLLSPNNNYRTYRALLDATLSPSSTSSQSTSSTSPSTPTTPSPSTPSPLPQISTPPKDPIIPILGILLKDLLFINDGNKTILESGLVNFSKFRTLYRTVVRFGALQGTCYPPLNYAGMSREEQAQQGVVAEFVRNLRSLKQDALYKYSCLCEAKSGDAEAVRLRDKWMKEEKSRK
ncbi:hypothetical protein HK104_000954, partial [Borealophlyctis nickersoniae]